jgi:hypothetical protein
MHFQQIMSLLAPPVLHLMHFSKACQFSISDQTLHISKESLLQIAVLHAPETWKAWYVPQLAASMDTTSAADQSRY